MCPVGLRSGLHVRKNLNLCFFLIDSGFSFNLSPVISYFGAVIWVHHTTDRRQCGIVSLSLTHFHHHQFLRNLPSRCHISVRPRALLRPPPV